MWSVCCEILLHCLLFLQCIDKGNIYYIKIHFSVKTHVHKQSNTITGLFCTVRRYLFYWYHHIFFCRLFRSCLIQRTIRTFYHWRNYMYNAHYLHWRGKVLAIFFLTVFFYSELKAILTWLTETLIFFTKMWILDYLNL